MIEMCEKKIGKENKNVQNDRSLIKPEAFIYPVGVY